MKTKHFIIIGLVVIFNEFVGAIVNSSGILLARLGNLLSSLPEIF